MILLSTRDRGNVILAPSQLCRSSYSAELKDENRSASTLVNQHANSLLCLCQWIECNLNIAKAPWKQMTRSAFDMIFQ